jgi:hypothetical protein
MGKCEMHVHNLHDVHRTHALVNFVKVVNVDTSFSPNENTST